MDLKRMADLINFRSGTLVEFKEPEAETVERFSYVIDTLGNVEIADTILGKKVYLEGEDALEAIAEIGDKTGDSLQQVLAHYKHVME